MNNFPITIELSLIELASDFFHNKITEQDTQDRLEILKEQFGEGIYRRYKDIFYSLIGTSFCDLKCTCGANYTSRPNFHYDWCDLKRIIKPLPCDSNK